MMSCLDSKLKKLYEEIEKKLEQMEICERQLNMEKNCQMKLRLDNDSGSKRVINLQKYASSQRKKARFLRSNRRKETTNIKDQRQRLSEEMHIVRFRRNEILLDGKCRNKILNQNLRSLRIKYDAFYHQFETWRNVWPISHELLAIEPDILKNVNNTSTLQGLLGERNSLADVTFALQEILSPNPGTEKMKRSIAFDAPFLLFKKLLAVRALYLLRDVDFIEKKIISMDGTRRKIRNLSFRILCGMNNDLHSVREMLLATGAKTKEQIGKHKSSERMSLSSILDLADDGKDIPREISSAHQVKQFTSFAPNILNMCYHPIEIICNVREKMFKGYQHRDKCNDIQNLHVTAVSFEVIELLIQSKLSLYASYKGDVMISRIRSTTFLPTIFRLIPCNKCDSSSLGFHLERLKYLLARALTSLALDTFYGAKMWTSIEASDAAGKLQKLQCEVLKVCSDEPQITTINMSNETGIDVRRKVDFYESGIGMISPKESENDIASFYDVGEYFLSQEKKIKKRVRGDRIKGRNKFKSVVAAEMKSRKESKRETLRANQDEMHAVNGEINGDYPKIVRKWVSSSRKGVKLPSEMIEKDDEEEASLENLSASNFELPIMSVDRQNNETISPSLSALQSCPFNRRLKSTLCSEQADYVWRSMKEVDEEILLLEGDARIAFTEKTYSKIGERAKIQLYLERKSKTIKLLLNFLHRREEDLSKRFVMIISAGELNKIFGDSQDIKEISRDNDSLFSALVSRLRLEQFPRTYAYRLILKSQQLDDIHKASKLVSLGEMDAYETPLTVLTLRTKIKGHLRFATLGTNLNLLPKGRLSVLNRN